MNLSNANLIEADLAGANLSKPNLHDTYSPDTEWTLVKLSGPDLRWALLNLTKATLVESDFT